MLFAVVVLKSVFCIQWNKVLPQFHTTVATICTEKLRFLLDNCAPCSVPVLPLGGARPCGFPFEVMRHIGSLLHLAKRRACMFYAGCCGDICKYLLRPASRGATQWRPSKPSTTRFVWKAHKYVRTFEGNGVWFTPTVAGWLTLASFKAAAYTEMKS